MFRNFLVMLRKFFMKLSIRFRFWISKAHRFAVKSVVYFVVEASVNDGSAVLFGARKIE